jgi:UDP-2,3-diacylglucosamine pyrophosphatase LpxH
MSVTRKQLPAYWEKHVAEKIAQIKALQAKTKDCFCVGMITDFHWLENEKYSVPLLERILADCQIPYFFQAGDIVSGQGICPPSRIVVEMVDNQTEFSEIISQCLYVEGNHDRAYSTFSPPAYYKENIQKAEFDETYFRTVKRIATNYAEGGYYYVDDEKAKVRYIALNSHDALKTPR